MDYAYLNFLNYANENIQHARESLQFNDLNFLQMQKERLELLVSMCNQLLLNINEDSEISHTISTYLRELQVLLNQYVVQISQLGDEEFVNVNFFILKEISGIGKYYIN